MTNKSTYLAGETATFTADAAGAASASVTVGGTAHAMTIADGIATAKVPTTGMSGAVRYAVYLTSSGGDVEVRESGAFTVRALVSKYRAVVEAIDAALAGVAKNGKYSVSVGEISMQDKTFAEMLAAMSYYRARAEEDEGGEAETGRVQTIATRFV